jgi:tetratricopeptide (TPR) repeat protein
MKFSQLSIQSKFFLTLSSVIILMMILLSTYCGPSNDESFQIPYGKQALNYYTSFGSNDSVLDYKLEPLMKNYGALVDMIPEAIHRITGFELMKTRHMVIAFISFFYILLGSLIAKRIAGWNAAFFTLALLTILPRIFGEALNNPKDPPYAATYLLSIYAFMVFYDNILKVDRKVVFILFLGFMSTMLVRVSGLMAVFYFGIFLIYEYITLKKSNLNIEIKPLSIRILIAGFFGYFVSIFFWPSMMNNPLTQPLDALKMLQQYPITLRNLFDGNYIQSNTVPWNYNLKYFLISNPEVTLIGIFLGFILFFKMSKVYNQRRILLLLFSSIFPLFFIIYKKTALLTGWRHSYFIFVPLVIFSGITFGYIYDYMTKSKLQKSIFIGIVAVGLAFPALFMVRNFPMFYTYFNPTFGGLKKAMGNYELDYYSHSIMPAIKWLEQNEPGFEKKILASNNTFQVSEILKPKYGVLPVYYTRYRERYDQDWDYNILTQSFVDAQYLRNGFFGNSKDVIKTIDVDGVPICLILKRQDKNDFYGKKALDSNNFPKAIEFLNKAIQYNPNNEIAWTNLGLAQLNSNQPNEAVQSLSNALKISPESMMAKNYLAYAYLQSGNLTYAQSVLMNLIEENPNNPEPYKLLGQIYQQQGNGAMAQQYLGIYQQIMAQMGGQ